MKRKTLTLLLALITTFSLAASVSGCDFFQADDTPSESVDADDKKDEADKEDGEEKKDDKKDDDTKEEPSSLEFTFNYVDTTYFVSGIGNVTNANVTIPETYKNYPVTAIYDYAFVGCTTMKSVVIPDSITSIGEGAFSGCSNLESMTLPFVGDSATHDLARPFGYIFGTDSYDGGVAIEQFCQGTTNWINITYYIPASLKKIYINEESIIDFAFYKCTMLEEVIIGNDVKRIADGAFEKCTSLTSITLPDSVTYLAYHVFYETGYYNDNANWKNGVLYLDRHLLAADRDVVTGTLTVKAGTLTIADSAFLDCKNITGLVLPDGLVTIASLAFDTCTALETINIPDTVTHIGNMAFTNCSSLKSLTLPTSLVRFGYYPFDDCTSLVSINYKGTKAQWEAITCDEYNWYDCSNVVTVYCLADGQTITVG